MAEGFSSMDDLKDSDDDDDDDDTEVYFKSITPILQKMYICDLSEDVIKTIVYLINSTKRYDTDWRLYASEILGHNGRLSRLQLAEIKGDADSGKRLPLYVALTGTLKENKTMADIVHALLKRNRFDVLKEIRPVVEGFQKEETSCNFHNNNNSTKLMNIGENTPAEHLVVNLPNISVADESLQTNNAYVKQCLTVNLPRSKIKLKKSILSIFVPHARKDTATVRECATILSEDYNIHVTLLCDIQHLIIIDDCEALYGILEEVDFNVPAISPTYLNYIRLGTEFQMLCDDAKQNRLIFQWMLSEFMDNASCNFRVKPIVMPDMNVQHLRRHRIPLFKYVFQFPTGLPELVETLINTKRDMPRLLKRHNQITSK